MISILEFKTVEVLIEELIKKEYHQMYISNFVFPQEEAESDFYFAQKLLGG